MNTSSILNKLKSAEANLNAAEEAFFTSGAIEGRQAVAAIRVAEANLFSLFAEAEAAYGSEEQEEVAEFIGRYL